MGGQTLRISEVMVYSQPIQQVFTGEVPFQDIPDYQIISASTSGMRPERKAAHRIRDSIWSMMTTGWSGNRDIRPTILEYCDLVGDLFGFSAR
jgi:hypothetical protein